MIRTGPRYFSNWHQFCKFDMPNCKIKYYLIQQDYLKVNLALQICKIDTALELEIVDLKPPNNYSFLWATFTVCWKTRLSDLKELLRLPDRSSACSRKKQAWIAYQSHRYCAIRNEWQKKQLIHLTLCENPEIWTEQNRSPIFGYVVLIM